MFKILFTMLLPLSQSAIIANCNSNINYIDNINTSLTDQEVDLNQLEYDAIYYSYKINNPLEKIQSISNINKSKIEQFNVSGEQIGKEVISKNPKALFFGTSTLTNNTDVNQKLNTQVFSRTVINTNTVTTTVGMTITTKVSLKICDVTVAVNFVKSSTSTVTSSETLTSPSQSIEVPKHNKYVVNVYLDEQTVTAKIKLNVSFKGDLDAIVTTSDGTQVRYSTNFTYGVYCASLFNGVVPKDNIITFAPDLSSFTFNGLSEFVSAAHGSDYFVEVKNENIA